jgi:adenosylcobinamide-GDP ribazoletransferase
VLAVLTRGLHLDGLADTVDALGVKGADEGARERRLAVMRAPDVGAFGAVMLVLVLVVQVLALAACIHAGRGTVGLVTACVVARLAITWACTRPVPSARPDGLGAAVAGTVPVVAAALLTLGAVLIAAGIALAASGTAGLGPATVGGQGAQTAVALVVSIAVGLAIGALVVRRAVQRFGGITGDVLGATSELAFTATVLALALLP